MKPRITILPSLRLGGSQQPQPLLVVLRRGFNPIPRPFPSPGEGMQPLASARSVTKVSATHQRVAGRSPTQQSCDCLCGLRPRLLQLCYMEPTNESPYLITPKCYAVFKSTKYLSTTISGEFIAYISSLRILNSNDLSPLTPKCRRMEAAAMALAPSSVTVMSISRILK